MQPNASVGQDVRTLVSERKFSLQDCERIFSLARVKKQLPRGAWAVGATCVQYAAAASTTTNEDNSCVCVCARLNQAQVSPRARPPSCSDRFICKPGGQFGSYQFFSFVRSFVVVIARCKHFAYARACLLLLLLFPNDHHEIIKTLARSRASSKWRDLTLCANEHALCARARPYGLIRQCVCV